METQDQTARSIAIGAAFLAVCDACVHLMQMHWTAIAAFFATYQPPTPY